MLDALIVYYARLRGLLSRVPFDTLFELAGICVVAYGVAMIFIPAGVIALGVGLCFVGVALSSAPPVPTTTGGEPE